MNIIANMLCSCKDKHCELKQSALSEMFVYARCAAWPNIFFHVHPESTRNDPLISIEIESCKIIANLYHDRRNGDIIKYETIITNIADPDCYIKLRKYILKLLYRYLNEAIVPYNEAIEIIKKLL